jgi:hypothetical protein
MNISKLKGLSYYFYPTTHPSPMTIQNFLSLVALWGLFLACAREAPHADAHLEKLPDEISFNFHIRPILSDRCYACHGPDEAAIEANLRLDNATSAYTKLDNGRKAIHPGKLKKSEVWHRIYSDDPEEAMPPPESNLSLTDYEKALIAKWIRQGAEYEPHWAFIPPEKTSPPKIKDKSLIQNPIDQFVLAKLERENLTFSPEAGKKQLLRRLSFDLTGLPPSLQELDAFLKDDSPDAYEKVVDRLLTSDAYAERMTMDWLDLARYADSQGLHSDGWRSMYPWRDWVIGAFKENMPFDQFLTWQLAGDLLPDPTRDQRIATGFHRNHKTTAEGGVVDEEYRQEYVHDRVATTGTVMLGLTMECARCHDHKYDPVSQEEYYQLFAFFNQVDELGLTGDDGNAGPNLLLPAPKTEAYFDSLQKEIIQKQAALTHSEQEIADQKAYIKQLNKTPYSIGNQRDAFLPFDQLSNKTLDDLKAASLSAGAEIVDTERGKAVALDGEYEFITIKEQGIFEQNQAFAASVWIYPEGRSATQTIVGNTGPKGVFWRGWDLFLDSLNHLSFRLVHALPHDVAAVSTLDTIPVKEWTHIAFSYDGMGKAGGIRLYINGRQRETLTRYDCLQRSIHPISFNKSKSRTPLRLGKSYRAFTGEYGIFEGKLDDFSLFSRELSALEIAELAEINTLQDMLAAYQKEPSPDLENQLFETWKYRNQHPLKTAIAALRQQQINVLDTVPEVMIMQEMETYRPTFVLNRGIYDQPLQEVFSGTPSAILPFPDTLPRNRLGLARWLLNPKHPLTARVTVNRFWQQFFGQGLVDTPHDFGLQGSLPTHPELLDWLAVHFMESGWDVKAILKTIVLSATYRQASEAGPELREKDPDNELLARGPSYRLPAEMIRDNALAAGGLLERKIGGPSVKPVQPEGLWREKTSSTHLLRAYEPDTGSARYRRSMYTFVRRTSPPPAMNIFDAPNRSVCIAQRQRTNTPMQALVLLNDPQFIEAARALAREILEQDNPLASGLSLAFRKLTGRKPSVQQLDQLKQLYREEKNRFTEHQEDALSLLSIGQYPVEESLPLEELAAMTLTVNTMMNFDEFYMKR